MHLHTYTPPLLAISEGLARAAVWHCVELSALLAPWGSVPRDWQVATNLQQLQELAEDALTCSK